MTDTTNESNFIKGTQAQKDKAVALYEKNMAWLKENPFLYEIVNTIQAIDKSRLPTLTFDENGYGNIEQDNTFLYDHKEKGSEKYYEDLKDSDMGIGHYPYQHWYFQNKIINSQDVENNAHNTARIHCYNLNSKLQRKFTENEDLLDKNFDSTTLYDNSFYGIIASVLLGYHLKEFMNRRNPTTVAIFDSNTFYLFLSFHCVDYEEIFGHIDHRNFKIVISSSITTLHLKFRLASRDFSDIALRSASYVFLQPDNIIRSFILKAGEALNSMLIRGYFQDEVGMQFNTMFNLKHSDKLLTNGHPIINDIPVFIIGSGPSLSNDMEYIKKNKDKALLVACGSSLQAFKANDLKPDIYVWLEKDQIWYESFRNNDYNLEDTVFFCTTANPPYKGIGRISSPYYIHNTRLSRTVFAEKFKDTLSFVRSNVQDIWDSQHNFTMSSEGPTVTNTAYGFINKIGFTNTYLFGTDLGRKTEKHHCDYLEETMSESDKILYHEDNQTNVKQVRANFGGVATTMFPYDLGLSAFKIITEAFKQNKPYLKLYNCSDGAYISGATPLLSSEIDLPELKKSKREILDDVLDFYHAIPRNNVLSHWNRLYNKEEFDQYREKLIAFFEDEDLDWHAGSLYGPLNDAMTTNAVFLKRLLGGTLTDLILLAQDAYAKVKKEHQKETLKFIKKTVLDEVIILFDKADLILKTYNAYMINNSMVDDEDRKQILMYRNDVSVFNFDKSGLENPAYAGNNKLFSHEALLDELMVEINTKIAPKLISSNYKEYTGVGTALNILKNPFRLEYISIESKAKLLNIFNKWVESTQDQELILQVKEIQAQTKLPTKPVYGDMVFARKTFDYLTFNDLDEDFNRHLYAKMRLTLDYEKHLELKNTDIINDLSQHKERKEFMQEVVNNMKDDSNIYDNLDYYYKQEILSYNIEKYRQPVESEHYMYDKLAEKLTPILIDYMLKNKSQESKNTQELNLLDEYYNLLSDHMKDETISIYDRGTLLALDFLLCPIIEEKVINYDLEDNTLNDDFYKALKLTNKVLEIPVIINRHLNVHYGFDLPTKIDFDTVKDTVLETIDYHKKVMNNWIIKEKEADQAILDRQKQEESQKESHDKDNETIE